MKITDVEHQTAPSDLSLTSTVSEPNKADVDYFAAQLNPEGGSGGSTDLGEIKVKPTSEVSPFLSDLARTFANNDHQRDVAFKDLKDASRSSDMLAMSRASNSISNYYIESLMNAKIVSKTTQSLDKLTNLQ